jgi:phosphoglucosamine mutase
VLELLQEHGGIVGGESSGHIICLDRTTTGDGIVSALQVLAAMVQSGSSLRALRTGMSKFPQIMINVPLSGGADVVASPSVAKAVKDAEDLMHGRGRVLLRPSGTEPLIRVMVEGEDETLVRQQAEYLADVVARTVEQEAQSA